MSAVTSFDDTLLKMATKGQFNGYVPNNIPAVTSAGATSGFFNVGGMFGGQGELASTAYTTLFTGPKPGVTDVHLALDWVGAFVNNARALHFGWFYKFGTVNFAATGDQFTHDAATFPVLRTRMGAASQPVPLFPFVLLTAATATTAPQFLLKTAAGGTGYKDQDGNNVVGTKTFTFPAAATVIASGFPLTIEDADYAVRDIVAINTTVAGSAGTGVVLGFEPLCSIPSPAQGVTTGLTDLLGESLLAMDMRPAVATSGTAAAYFGAIVLGVLASATLNNIQYFAHRND